MRALRLNRLSEWLLPSARFPRDDAQAYSRAASLLLLAYSSTVVVTSFAFIELRFGGVFAPLLFFIATLIILESWMFRHLGHARIFSNLVVGTLVCGVVSVLLLSAGRAPGGAIVLPLFVLLGMLVLQRWHGVFWAMFAIVGIVVGYNLKRVGVEPLLMPDAAWASTAVYRVSAVACLLGAGFGLFFIRNYERILRRLNVSRDNESRLLKEVLSQKERFSDFAGIAADWFWETDANGQLIYVSPGFAELFGMHAQDMLGREPVEIAQTIVAGDRRARNIPNPLLERLPFHEQKLFATGSNGERIVLLNSGRPVHDADGRFLGYRGVVVDASETFCLTDELRRLAHSDPLTDLANRRAFSDILSHHLHTSGRGWLVCIDLDHFKQVNDNFGHEAGDRLLRDIAVLLRKCVRSEDTVARLGGDEFCILLADASRQIAERVGDDVLRGVAELGQIDAAYAGVGASVGMVAVADDDDVDAMLRRADHACYEAKRGGRHRVVLIEQSV